MIDNIEHSKSYVEVFRNKYLLPVQTIIGKEKFNPTITTEQHQLRLKLVEMQLYEKTIEAYWVSRGFAIRNEITLHAIKEVAKITCKVIKLFKRIMCPASTGYEQTYDYERREPIELPMCQYEQDIEKISNSIKLLEGKTLKNSTKRGRITLEKEIKQLAHDRKSKGLAEKTWDKECEYLRRWANDQLSIDSRYTTVRTIKRMYIKKEFLE